MRGLRLQAWDRWLRNLPDEPERTETGKGGSDWGRHADCGQQLRQLLPDDAVHLHWIRQYGLSDLPLTGAHEGYASKPVKVGK